MNKHVFKQPVILSYLVPIIFTLGMIFMVMYGLSVTGRASESEGIRVLKESVTRAAVTCYAIEGSYPSDLTYIEENYGVRIDRAKYEVRYSIFASNIMPDIEVVLLEQTAKGLENSE